MNLFVEYKIEQRKYFRRFGLMKKVIVPKYNPI